VLVLTKPEIFIVSPLTSNDEIFVAGAGDDTLTGNGGMDVFNAGSGKDSILINASNISALEQTDPKCSFGINVGITMSINIISNTILSLDFCLDKA
jgi:Ca2+-binding RTX toxin-like protein